MNSNIQNLIREINSNNNLSQLEKTKKIQELYNSNSKSNIINSKLNINKKDLNNNDSNNNDSNNATYNCLEKQKISCTHYTRNCDLISICCKKRYACRLCHNANEEHEMNRYDTKEIICNECDTIQSISNQCINCEIKFGDYFCGICGLWSSDDRDIFHCDKCNICRIGKREDFDHCDKCNCCITKGVNHKCINNIFKTDCTICMEPIFDSREPISQLSCGHVIHKKCLQDYIGKNNYKCPLCKKSLGDMSKEWEIQRKINQIQPIPDEYKNWIQKIYCFDCENHSYTRFSLLSFECYKCLSFNIQQIDRILPESSNYLDCKKEMMEDYKKRNEKLNISEEILQEPPQEPPQETTETDSSESLGSEFDNFPDDINLNMDTSLSDITDISSDSDI